MSPLPASICDFILALTFETRAPAYLLVDADNKLVEWGGNLDSYNITGLQKNVEIDQQVYFLAGVLPLEDENVFLPSVKMEGGLYADIHFFRAAEGTWILFLDASVTTIEQRRLQQKAYDLELERND